MKTKTYNLRNENKARNNFRRKWLEVFQLTGLYLVANLVSNFFMDKEIELISSLAGAATFGLFVAIGVFSTKRKK